MRKLHNLRLTDKQLQVVDIFTADPMEFDKTLTMRGLWEAYEQVRAKIDKLYPD